MSETFTAAQRRFYLLMMLALASGPIGFAFGYEIAQHWDAMFCSAEKAND